MLDAEELLEFAAIPPNSTIIVISRSGRSIEIVNLLAKVRGRGVTVIAITNSDDGPLGRVWKTRHAAIVRSTGHTTPRVGL
jgi:glutamine---fructose-6-phosphate transaminase (isomerizing)